MVHAGNRHNASKKPEYNTVVTDCSDNIVTEIDNCKIMMPNKEPYKPEKNHEEGASNYLENNNSASDNNANSIRMKRVMIILSFACVMILFLCHLSFPILSMITNSILTTMNDYSVKIQFTIFIPNNTDKKTEYQHILVDSFDNHIEQQKYDYKIVSLKEENLFEQNTFNNSQVSKSKYFFVIKKRRKKLILYVIYVLFIIYV